MFYASHVKLFAETLEFLLYAMFELDIHRIASLGHNPSGGQEVGSWSVLNWACKEDEEQQATPLLQLPRLCVDWCAVWHYNAGGRYSFSCLARPFNFMSAHIALN